MSALTPSAVAARPPAWPRAWTRFMVIGILGALILGGALVAGSLPRLREQAAVQKSTEAGIHSRTTGYIVKRPVDIGDRVAEGDLLAEIATPEIDAQLEQSRATVLQSQADLVRDQANEADRGSCTDELEVGSFSHPDLMARPQPRRSQPEPR